MKLLVKAFRIYQDVTSLGGTYRIRAARDRYFGLRKVHDQVRGRLSRYNVELAETRKEIENQVEVAKRHLKSAERILRHAPGVDLDPVLSPAVAERAQVRGTSDLLVTLAPAGSMKTGAPTIAGIGAGAATSAGTWWGATQALAHSSTSAAVAGFPKAAVRVGLAGFRGKSVATATAAGAGIASSPLVLTGVGAAVAVAVSAKMSHSRASELSRISHELERAHLEGSSALSKIRSEVERLKLLQSTLENGDRDMWKVIGSIRRKLFRFGPLSHLWRLLQLRIGGNYYMPQELPLVEQVQTALTRFTSAFKGAPLGVPSNQPELLPDPR